MKTRYSLNDVINHRGSYLTITVPRESIKKVYIPQRIDGIIRDACSLDRNFTSGLAEKVARELKKQRGDDCDFELEKRKAGLMNQLNPQDISAGFMQIFSMYYGPFFGHSEYGIKEISKQLRLSENDVYHQLLDMDTEFFIPCNPVKTDYSGPFRRVSDHKK